MEDKILEVKSSRVREAARECSNAKLILRTLFPEAFEEKGYYIGTVFVFVKDQNCRVLLAQSLSNSAKLIQLRNGSLYNHYSYRKDRNGKVMVPEAHLVGFVVEIEPASDPTSGKKTKSYDPDDEDDDE